MVRRLGVVSHLPSRTRCSTAQTNPNHQLRVTLNAHKNHAAILIACRLLRFYMHVDIADFHRLASRAEVQQWNGPRLHRNPGKRNLFCGRPFVVGRPPRQKESALGPPSHPKQKGKQHVTILFLKTHLGGGGFSRRSMGGLSTKKQQNQKSRMAWQGRLA